MSVFRNRLIKSTTSYKSSTVTIAQSMPGDICLYDKLNNKNIIVSGSFTASDFPLDLYTPVGIVVVPGLHKLYGDNTCSIISLVEMSCDTPQIGTNIETSMCFSPQSDLVTKNYNVVIVKDDGVLKTNGFGYLSKNGIYASSTLKIPDPYNDDMTRNPDYYDTSVSIYNAMSDFNGRESSNLILGMRGVKNYVSWKPISTTGNNYPAISCCDMYHTDGTAQGQWYLPAAGEWGYVMSKWDMLQKSISMLNKIYGNQYLPLTENASYWTCTEHNGKNTRYVHTSNGMGHTTKTTSIKVRAFLILKEQLQFPIYLYTSEIDADFFRRTADTLMLDIIDWYGQNCVVESNGRSYIPNDILAGKLFIDDYEVTSIQYSPSVSIEFLMFETGYDYDMNEPLKVIQYHPTSSVSKGTIDVMA